MNLVRFTGRTVFLVFVLCAAVSGTMFLHLPISLASPSPVPSSVPHPDFSLGTTTPHMVPANGAFAESMIIVNFGNNFEGTVRLTDMPPDALNCLPLNPSSLRLSGQSSLACASTTPGTYQVKVNGTSGLLSHTTTATFTFTPIPVTATPDVTLSTSSSSLSFNGGASGTLTITVSPLNGFTGTVALSTSAPSGVSCNFSPTSILTTGTSVLTCSSNAGGDYNVTLTAIGGATPHSKSIAVHVAAASPAPPAPSTTVAPAITYGVAGGVIVALVIGTIFVLRRSRHDAVKTPNASLLFT